MRQVLKVVCGCGLKLAHEWRHTGELVEVLDWLAKEHKGRGHRAKAEVPAHIEIDAEALLRQFQQEEQHGDTKGGEDRAGS